MSKLKKYAFPVEETPVEVLAETIGTPLEFLMSDDEWFEAAVYLEKQRRFDEHVVNHKVVRKAFATSEV